MSTEQTLKLTKIFREKLRNIQNIIRKNYKVLSKKVIKLTLDNFTG